MLWRFNGETGKEERILKDTDPTIHTIFNTPNDCDGDILFDYMTEHGLVEDWDEYETDGDSESVAVIHKTGSKPDYRWGFRANAPTRPASDDCHTYS